MQELPEKSARSLARVTTLLRTQRTLPAQLEAVVAVAKRTVPNCDAAGISLVVDGEPTTTAVGGRLAVEIDLVQYRTGQGPGLLTDIREVVRIDVLEGGSRFSRIAPGALARDTNSVLSRPLPARDGVVGALDLYSGLPNAFDPDAEQVIEPLAAYAAGVIATSPLYAYTLDMVDGLLESLETQAITAQACGIIAVTERLTSEEAAERLRTLALVSGESLRQVSDWIIEERPRGTAPPGRDHLSDLDLPE